MTKLQILLFIVSCVLPPCKYFNYLCQFMVTSKFFSRFNHHVPFVACNFIYLATASNCLTLSNQKNMRLVLVFNCWKSQFVISFTCSKTIAVTLAHPINPGFSAWHSDFFIIGFVLFKPFFCSLGGWWVSWQIETVSPYVIQGGHELVILPPKPPKQLGLQVYAAVSSLYYRFLSLSFIIGFLEWVCFFCHLLLCCIIYKDSKNIS